MFNRVLLFSSRRTLVTRIPGLSLARTQSRYFSDKVISFDDPDFDITKVVFPKDKNGQIMAPPPIEKTVSVDASELGKEENKEEYKCYIFKPSRIVTQNMFGENHNKWQIQFEIQDQFQSPLTGWTGGTGVTGCLRGKLQFESMEEAIAYAERKNFNYEVKKPAVRKKTKPKNYGSNFTKNNARYDDE